jgi:hypothetical protein
MKEISCSDIFFRDLHIGLEFMILAYYAFFCRKCVTVVQLILQRPSRRVYELKKKIVIVPSSTTTFFIQDDGRFRPKHLVILNKIACLCLTELL